VNDATILLRSIAGDAATKTASKVIPSEEQLGQLDEAAPDNTWHEVPDFSKGNIKKTWSERNPLGTKEIKDAAGNATQAAHPNGSRDPADLAGAAATEQQTGGNQLKDTASENVSEQSKSRAREYRERTTRYLQGKMPKERREQTIWRLKKMIVEIQGHQDCKFAFSNDIGIMLTRILQMNRQSKLS
jgi:hypothetical protein